MSHPLDYWKAVALAITAENMKAAVYASHNDEALGAAREAILRKIVVEQTPAMFEVKTGFVHDPDSTATSAFSRQCDILVFDAWNEAPLYRLDEFIVATNRSAKFVAEVKSTLKKNTFDDVVAKHKSLTQFRVPLFCIAYDSSEFAKICEYISQHIQGDIESLPECIAVHERNYFFARPAIISSAAFSAYYVAIDLSRCEVPGLATANWFSFYDTRLRGAAQGLFANDLNLYRWFDELELPPDAKRKIHISGAVSTGRIREASS